MIEQIYGSLVRSYYLWIFLDVYEMFLYMFFEEYKIFLDFIFQWEDGENRNKKSPLTTAGDPKLNTEKEIFLARFYLYTRDWVPSFVMFRRRN